MSNILSPVLPRGLWVPLLVMISMCSKSPVPVSPVEFREHLIMDGYAYAYGLWAADLDGDGDLDLTSADACHLSWYSESFCAEHNNLYWFENDGRGQFERHYIAKAEPGRLERHMAGDLDGDGDPDIVVVKNESGEIVYFENRGPSAVQEAVWPRHLVTTQLPGAYDVVLSDLDGDDDLDIAASSWTLGNQFAWFENSGTPLSGEWIKRTIDTDLRNTRTIRVADFDHDGDPDLLGTALGGDLVVWYENGGKSATDPWTKHIIDSPSGPWHGEPIDMDADGDPDVLMALSGEGQIVWYENVDAENGERSFEKHLIHEGLPKAFEAVGGDLDEDGDMDVVVTQWGDLGKVVWFENLQDDREGWKMHILKDSWPRANSVLVVDLNADNRLDIVAGAEKGVQELRWWENLGR